MDREEQLQWERRNARWAAAAAFAAALLALAGFLYQRSVKPVPQNVAQFLVSLDGKSSDYLTSSIISAVGVSLLAPVLYYLYRATKFRRGVVPRVALVLAIVAPIAYGGVLVGTELNQASLAHQFVREDPGAKTVVVGKKTVKKEDDRKGSVNDHAKKKLSSSGALAGVSIASTFAIAVAFVLLCLNAMRAGLLSRFMGSLGMVIGALYVFQFLIPPGIVELFWLPALGLIFLDRFPQGRGPAWDTGEAVPWPTAQSRRDALTGGGTPDREPVAPDEPRVNGQSHTGEPARPRQSTSHPRSKKRKRKRG